MSDARLKHADVRSEVETTCPAGHDQVLRCHPLRLGGERFEPFPTLFWLVCPQLTYDLSRLEHEGWITRLQERLANDEAFRAEVERDHEVYAQERWSLLSEGRARRGTPSGAGARRARARHRRHPRSRHGEVLAPALCASSGA